MDIEYKAWKTAEGEAVAARVEEAAAYAAFRKNMNKRSEWRTARWGVVIADAATDAAFAAYLEA